jgi:tetratricopeptide (TPR) repeat protein
MVSSRLTAAKTQQAYLDFRLGHYQAAKQTATDLLELSAPMDATRADAYLILGNVSAETGSLSDAEAWYTRATDLSRTIGYRYVRIRSQHNLAMGVYFAHGQFALAQAAAEASGALAWAEDALDVAQRAGYAHMQGLAWVEVGRALWLQGDLGQAETALRQAMAILEPLQANYDLARASLELAGLLLEARDPLVRSVWQETG